MIRHIPRLHTRCSLLAGMHTQMSCHDDWIDELLETGYFTRPGDCGFVGYLGEPQEIPWDFTPCWGPTFGIAVFSYDVLCQREARSRFDRTHQRWQMAGELPRVSFLVCSQLLNFWKDGKRWLLPLLLWQLVQPNGGVFFLSVWRP